MTKNCFLLVTSICCFTIIPASAQLSFKKTIAPPGVNQNNTWAFALSAISFDANTLYTCGFQHAGPARDKAVVAALTAGGDLIWCKTYATTPNNEQAKDIAPTPEGNLIVLMERSSPAGSQMGAMKVTPNGDILWSKTYGNGRTGEKVSVVADGFILAGSAKQGGIETPLVLKTDPDGNVVWQRSIELPGAFNTFTSSVVANDGSVFVSGNYSTGSDIHGIVLKITAAGAIVWCKSFDTGGFNLFRDLTMLSDGTIVAAGQVSGQAWILHLDDTGNVLSSNVLSPLNNGFLDASSITSTPDDKVLLTLSLGVLAKVGPDAAIEWAYQLGNISDPGATSLFKANNLPGAGFLVAGIDKPGPLNLDQMLLVRTDQDGRPGDCCVSAMSYNRSANTAMVNEIPIIPSGTVASADYILAVETVTPAIVSICQSAQINADFDLSRDSVCPFECVVLSLPDSIPPDAQVTWSFPPGVTVDSSGSPDLCFAQNGMYEISLTINLGTCRDSVSKTVTVASVKDQFPNAFTPNGDDVNDRFKPVYFCPVITSRFSIFNRWGKKVFESQDPNDAWDGRVDGEDAPSDVYVWQLEYEAIREGVRQKLMEKGDVALLR